MTDKIESAHSKGPFIAKGASTPIKASCNPHYRAYHNSGQRSLSSIKWIVMHSTEGNSAQGAASWFTDPKSQGSAHLVVDDTICYRCLNDQDIPWGAPGANTQGFHIEQTGYARWNSSLWSKTHLRTLQRAAYKAALHCRKYGIPIRFVDAAGLKAGRAGITTHLECTKAFGGTHVDPGKGWPKTLFIAMVKTYAAGMKIKVIA